MARDRVEKVEVKEDTSEGNRAVRSYGVSISRMLAVDQVSLPLVLYKRQLLLTKREKENAERRVECEL